MALKRANTHPNELKFAYRLLMYLHANLNNTYLLLAVVAWLRSESGQHYIGNNPLNLRPGADDNKYRVGVRRAGGNGYFSVYGSLDAGARATANRLLKAGHDYRGYGLMVDAMRGVYKDKDTNGDGKIDKGSGDVEQAQGFLWALIISKWDAGHYGLGKHHADRLKDIRNLPKTSLYDVWSGLLGHTVNMPADATADAVKPPKLPHQPRSLYHALDRYAFIQPYDALKFYEARNEPNSTLVGDPPPAT